VDAQYERCAVHGGVRRREEEGHGSARWKVGGREAGREAGRRYMIYM
jgi:hypothetical protein